MGIVFAVLALLALSIKILSIFDRDPTAPATASAPAPASAPEGITGQQVAAVAVALALSEPKATLGSPPSGPVSSGPSTGSWLQSGRIRSLGAGLNTRGRSGQ